MEPISAAGGSAAERAAVVIPLRQAHGLDTSLVGGKARNLGRLLALRMPVPSGFVVTTAAYRSHASRAFARGSMARGDGGDRARAIIETAIDDRLRGEVMRAVRRLRIPLLAVRSSAVGEDAVERSFAGVFETHLGVEGAEACLKAICSCWASLWRPSSQAYREGRSPSADPPAMAVIVQELIDAHASGVLFSADPATGRRDRMVIEACLGLGEVLVSGRVTPDRLVVSKHPIKILSKRIASKALRIRMDAAGGTVEETLPPALATQPALTTTNVLQLARSGLRIERTFGRPVDVEFAVANGQVHILQARPITALPEPQVTQVWSNLNTGEVFPGVLTPFTWSLVQEVERTIKRLMGRFRIDIGDAPLVGLVAGRVYFSVNAMVGLFRAMPGARFMDIDTFLGGSQGAAIDHEVLAAADPPTVTSNLLAALIRAPANVAWLIRHRPARAGRYLVRRRAAYERMRSVDAHELTDGQLLEHVRHLSDVTLGGTEGFVYMGAGAGAMSFLRVLTKRWLGDADGSLSLRLLTGMGGIESAEAALDLWRLAVRARNEPSVLRALQSADDMGAALATMRSEPAAAAFLAAFRAFLDEHGHHARGEIEVYSPRWWDQPEEVLGIVAGYLESDAFDPVDQAQRRRVEAADLIAACLQRLRNPLKRWFFLSVLRSARVASAQRENLKSVAVAFTAILRRSLQELGRRWAAQGIVTDPDDVFFVHVEELAKVSSASSSVWHDRIAERRANYRAHHDASPASVVIGDDLRPARMLTPPADPGVLRGLAASSGVARGPARVLLAAHTYDVVSAGEVLVAPYTDPGWTPAFLPAVAIVVDLGGLLSHGSILAREYGIPAVVNVGDATTRIASGDLIEVDGNAGVVRILARAATER